MNEKEYSNVFRLALHQGKVVDGSLDKGIDVEQIVFQNGVSDSDRPEKGGAPAKGAPGSGGEHPGKKVPAGPWSSRPGPPGRCP